VRTKVIVIVINTLRTV